MTSTRPGDVLIAAVADIAAHVRADPAMVRELTGRELAALIGWCEAEDTDVGLLAEAEEARRAALALT